MKLDAVYSQGAFDPKHPTISQSFLNMWADCALAGFYRYVEGKISPPGVAATQGSSVDAAVTAGCESVIETGKDAPLKDKREVAADVFEKKWSETLVFPEDNKDALKDQTIKMVDAHHLVIAPRLKPVSVQEAIVIPGPHYDMAGTIDLVEEDNVLADTKTSKRKYSDDAVSSNIQPSFYSMLYQAKYGTLPSRFRYDVLVKTKMPTAQQVSGVIGEAHLSLLQYRIKSVLEELKTGLETGYFRLAAPEHWRCISSGKWCAYLHNGCPKGKKI